MTVVHILQSNEKILNSVQSTFPSKNPSFMAIYTGFIFFCVCTLHSGHKVRSELLLSTYVCKCTYGWQNIYIFVNEQMYILVSAVSLYKCTVPYIFLPCWGSG